MQCALRMSQTASVAGFSACFHAQSPSGERYPQRSVPAEGCISNGACAMLRYQGVGCSVAEPPVQALGVARACPVTVALHLVADLMRAMLW